MKAKLWLMAVVMCVMPVVASAGTKWFIADGINQTCISARQAAKYIDPVYLNPLVLRNYLRYFSKYHGYTITQEPNGQIEVVLHYGPFGYHYFSTIGLCDKFINKLQMHGQDLNQLK